MRSVLTAEVRKRKDLKVAYTGACVRINATAGYDAHRYDVKDPNVSSRNGILEVRLTKTKFSQISHIGIE